MRVPLFHGGVPFLKIGDVIEPGHERRSHVGCPFCEARARGEAVIDPIAKHEDRVYFTPNRLYAKHYASLWGRGDLYRVLPLDAVEASLEDTVPSLMAPRLEVVAVLERAVLLTWSERRRLARVWAAADRAAGLTVRGVR